MKKQLTDRQQAILSFIETFTYEKGYPPTLREIGKEFDISSTFGVKRHIEALTKKGYLNFESNTSRAITLNNQTEKSVNTSNIVEIPIVGRVAAGYPILAEENIEGTLALDQFFTKGKRDCFALKVRGDSMIEAGIFEGDHVVISPAKEAVNGEIVVALLSDEATLKRFIIKDNAMFLKPENTNYSLIEVNDREDFSLVGKVIGVFRFYN